MNGELTPRERDARMSDADRERVMTRLQAAVEDGRLTFEEFQERADRVLRSRTFGEADEFVTDLPEKASGQARETAEIRATAAPLRRGGQWAVPRRLVVRSWAGSVKLDFTEATIEWPVVEIELDVSAGATTLILPANASADADDVEMIAGRLKYGKLRGQPGSTPGPHFRITGSQKYGALTIRPRRRRFLRRR